MHSPASAQNEPCPEAIALVPNQTCLGASKFKNLGDRS